MVNIRLLQYNFQIYIFSSFSLLYPRHIPHFYYRDIGCLTTTYRIHHCHTIPDYTVTGIILLEDTFRTRLSQPMLYCWAVSINIHSLLIRTRTHLHRTQELVFSCEVLLLLLWYAIPRLYSLLNSVPVFLNLLQTVVRFCK